MAKSFQKISTGNSPLYYALLNSSDWIRKLVMVVVVVYTYSPIIQNDIESFLAHTLQFCQQIKQKDGGGAWIDGGLNYYHHQHLGGIELSESATKMNKKVLCDYPFYVEFNCIQAAK